MVNSIMGTVAASAMPRAMQRTKSSVWSSVSLRPSVAVVCGAPGDRFERAGLRGLCLRAEVGQQVVVAGKAVERSGQRVGVERRGEELGGQVVGGHRWREASAGVPEKFARVAHQEARTKRHLLG